MKELTISEKIEVADAKLHTVECAWFFKHKGIYARIRRRSE
jgi:hypothetical protein